jgi:exopolysaccharide biosynthesis polyprenyl glycosylphosphotransferase
MTSLVESQSRLESPAPRLISSAAMRQSRLIANGGRMLLPALAVFGVYAAGRPVSAADAPVIATLTAIWLVSLRFGRSATPDPIGPAARTAIGALAGFVLVSATAVWLPPVDLSPGRLLAMSAAVLLFVGTWECVVQRTSAARRRVLVVGTPVEAQAVAHETSRMAAAVDLLGVVPQSAADNDAACGMPVVGTLDALSTVIEALQPDVVVVSDGVDCESALDRLLDMPRESFRVVGFTSFFEHALGRVPVSNLRASWFMSILHLRRRAYNRWSNRAFDLVFASLALLLALPVMVLIALVLGASGSVLYRQTRLGERGRRFTIIKFRTMSEAAEAPGSPVWSRDGDPRVTRVGQVLRHTHLDELPQLVNVLRGDMSMVGPRPERPEFVELLEQTVPFWHRRLLVKPGLTGWAQRKGGSASDYDAMADKLSYDLWYLRNRNVLVDLAICAASLLRLLALVSSRPHSSAPAARTGRAS